MPRMDGTGPVGTGAPGRGLGPCGKGSQTQPGKASAQDNFKSLGRGGRGLGRGRRQRRRISFSSFSGNNPGDN